MRVGTKSPLFTIFEEMKNIKQQTGKAVFKIGNVLHVIYSGDTSNKKLTRGKKIRIVQTAHYSKDQYEYMLNGGYDFSTFYAKDKANCMDCPFSSNTGNKKCYTRANDQWSGFRSQTRSTANHFGSWSNIPTLNDELIARILKMCSGKFIRFGTYGEPSLLPVELVDAMTKVSDGWTGYTHQWRKKPEYAPYFMASVETQNDERVANLIGYRSFLVAPKFRVGKGKYESPIWEQMVAQRSAVPCPASKELDKTCCVDCLMCSGTKGTNVKKSIVIQQH